MGADSQIFVAMELTGTFAFALNGALTAIRGASLDIVGMITLGMVTALGGGIIRDVLIGSLPPATFGDWRYLAVAAVGGLVAFWFARLLETMARPIDVLDAAGLSLFAVGGAFKALDVGLGPGQAVILGVVTAVGGGTIRDIMIGRVPIVLRSELYAIPALAAALVVVVTDELGVYGVPAAVGAAVLCFAIRLAGITFGLHAPQAPHRRME